MHARITPQYRNGQKLTAMQLMDAPKYIGMLAMSVENGQRVVRMDQPGGGGKNFQGELFNVVLTAMFSGTFRLTGIERSSTGAWVHQAWHCEVGGAWKHDERERIRKEHQAA